jgi:hypothetical protein
MRRSARRGLNTRPGLHTNGPRDLLQVATGRRQEAGVRRPDPGVYGPDPATGRHTLHTAGSGSWAGVESI